MAFKNPARDEISKFSPTVCQSLGIVCDACGVVDNLALTGFNMVDKVCG